jgi:hypothetical protein
MAQKLVTFAVGHAMPVDLARAKQRVRFALPRNLHLPRALHALTDRFRGLGPDRGHELGFARRRDFELEVDAVGERARDPTAVARNALRRAAATAGAIATMSARAGIHRGDQLESRRELRLAGGARDRYAPGLQRLAQRLENVAVEFRQLIEEQDAQVSERNFPRPR